MSIRSLIIRIGSDTKDIEKAFGTIGTGAKALDTQLKTLGSRPLGQELQKSLDQMNASIKSVTDGQLRLATQSVNAARGIEQLGGPARLTTSQLEQMNRTIQQGIDAFRALGQQAPAELTKVANAIKAQRSELDKASSGGTGIFGSVGSLLGAAGIGAGALTGVGLVASLTAEAKAALSFADSLTTLADRTGIGTEALQRLDAIAKPSGNTLEDVAVAVNRFQNLLVQGSDQTAGALDKIGLSLSQLRGLSPDEQFVAIAKGIQSIKDPAEQTRIAIELFGKGGAEILPTLKAKVDDLKDSTVIMSKEAVKALDDFGDALGRLEQSSKNFLGNIIANILTARSKQQAELDRIAAGQNLPPRPGAAVFTPPAAPVAPLAKPLAPIALSAQDLELTIRELERQRTAFNETNKAEEDYLQKLDAVNVKLRELSQPIEGLTAQQAKLADSYKALGLSNDDIAIKLRVSTTSITAYFSRLESGSTISKLAATDSVLLGSALEKVGEQVPVKEIDAFRLSLEKTLETLAKIQNPSIGQIDVGNLPLDVESLGRLKNLLANDKDAFDKLEASRREFRQGLSDLSQAFAQLAQVSGGSLGAVLGQLGQMVSGVNLAVKSFDQLKDSKGLLGKLTGAAGLVGSLVGLGTQVVKGLVNLITGGPEWKKFQKDVSRDFGVAISDGLAQALEKDSKTFGRQIAGTLHLDQIISEGGGIETFGIDKAIGKVHDLFTFLDQGRLSLQQVGSEFDKVFAEIAPAAIEKATGLARADFVQLVNLGREKGISSPNLDTFIQGQLSSIQTGLDEFLKHAMVGSQAAATAVSGAIGAIFAEAQRLGTPLATIVQQLGPVITAFQAQLQKTGFDGGAAFAEIQRLAALAADSIAGPMFSAVSGIQQALVGLANTGLLTQEEFTGFGDQIAETFNKLVAGGKNSDDVLRLMQPALQTLFELEERFGFTVDEATQALLDQAKAQGIVGDKFKSPQQQMIDGLTRVGDLLTAIAKKLGADIPAAAQAAADAIARIPDTVPAPFRPDKPIGAATGGLVTSTGIRRFGGGGIVPSGRVLPFLSRGTDTQLALLTPGEMVLNATQQGSLAAAFSAGGDVTVHVDARGAWFDGQGVEKLAGRIREEISKGGRTQTGWKKAVA